MFSTTHAVTSVTFDQGLMAGKPGIATLGFSNGQTRTVNVRESRLYPGQLFAETGTEIYKQAIQTKLAQLKQNRGLQLAPRASVGSSTDPTMNWIPSLSAISDSAQHPSAASSAFSVFAQITAAQNMGSGQGYQTTNVLAVAGNSDAQDAVVVRAFDPNVNAQMGTVGRGIVNGTTDLAHLAGSGVGGLQSGAQQALSSFGNGAENLVQKGDEVVRDAVPLGAGAARGVEQAVAYLDPDARELGDVAEAAAKSTCWLFDCVAQLCCDD